MVALESLIRIMHRESLVRPLGGFLPNRTSRSAGWSHNFLSGFSIGAAPNSTNTCRAQEIKSKPLILEKTVYKDNWFNVLSIHHLSNSIDSISGVKRQKRGYDGLIESASVVSRNKSSEEQQELVAKALARAFPMAVISMLKNCLPPSKFSREFFATFTTLFFSWLVGPCEVRESDFQGNKEKNVVYIPKCRFLETTNCVGMCTNLCKLPSQKFISNSLGMPTNMIPNFEDKSCEIIFGQHPPMDDPALKQPCYRTSCIAKQAHGVSCSS